MFIALTNNGSEDKVSINVENITAVYDQGRTTSISMGGNGVVNVRETYETVMELIGLNNPHK